MRRFGAFRALLAAALVAAFLVAYFLDRTDETLKGALIAAFSAAWGYWLGSSQGAAENRETLNRMAEGPKETP
jgi:hypothetical protein